jgi:hypothetical protein
VRNVLTAWQQELAPAVRKYRGVVYHRECIAHECGKATAEGKPYCLAHLEHMPYVASLLESVDLRRAVKKSARQSKAAKARAEARLRVAV